MATVAFLPPFEESFKELSISDTATRLGVSASRLWSHLASTASEIQNSAPISSFSSSALPLTCPPRNLLPLDAPHSSCDDDPCCQKAQDLDLVTITTARLQRTLSIQDAEVQELQPSDLRAVIRDLESQIDVYQQRLLEIDKEELPDVSKEFLSQRPRKKKAASYADIVQEWTRTGVALSDDVLMQVAGGAVAQLGPLTAELEHLRKQLEELTRARERCTKDTDLSNVSKMEFDIDAVGKSVAGKERELTEALKHLQETTFESSRQMSPRLAADRLQYTSVMEEMVSNEPGLLEQVNALAAELHNTGPLKIGGEANVVENGRLVRVRVERLVDVAAGGEEQYEVAFWCIKSEMETKWEEGFDTVLRRVGLFKRRDIYASKKQGQTLAADETRLILGQSATVSCKDPVFLMLMYAAAETSLERLRGCCSRLELLVPGSVAVVPELKGIGRVFAKTLEKYGGDFSQVGDLARATIKCPTLSGLLAVLQALRKDTAFTLVLIKNRIMSEYDADEAGGYRDILINLRDVDSGHIVELQVTLAPLLEVKMHGKGGHVAYEIARTLGLFSKGMCEHRGALTPHVFKGIACGLITVLDCSGRATELAVHFDHLIEAVKSKQCALVKLTLSDCGWPANRKVGELLEPLMEQCENLTHLQIDDDLAVGGELPKDIFLRLPKLRYCDFNPSSISGPIPSSIGSATNMEKFNFGSKLLTGSIPPELGQLQALKMLSISGDGGSILTGVIPPELGELRNLQVLSLRNNLLSGSIPSQLGQLQALQSLKANCNQLSGLIPAELCYLRAFQILWLHQNQLTGIVRPELGHLICLKDLRLNNNNLTGVIPHELGNLKSLTLLMLHNNQLTGPIPPQLGQLQSLEILTLNDNDLNGEIPAELDLLHVSLNELGLNNNTNLTGSIPPKLREKVGLELR